MSRETVCHVFFVYKDDSKLCCYISRHFSMAEFPPNHSPSITLSSVFWLISEGTCENDVLLGVRQFAETGADLNSVHGQCSGVHCRVVNAVDENRDQDLYTAEWL